MQDLNKEWQVETQGIVYEADLEELKQWISESAVLPSDRVKRGGLRWLPAEKVPELRDFIYSIELSCEATNSPLDHRTTFEDDSAHSDENAAESLPQQIDHTVCFFHPGVNIAYICDVCEHSFCKSCPRSFGGTVKLCPLCESLCRSIDDLAGKQRSVGAINKPYTPVEEYTPRVGFMRKSATFLVQPIVLLRNKLRLALGAKAGH